MNMLTGIELLQKVYEVQVKIKGLKIGDVDLGELVDDEIFVLRECGYTDEDKEGKEVVRRPEFLKAYAKAKEEQDSQGELTIIHRLIDHIDAETNAAKSIIEYTDMVYQNVLKESHEKLNAGDIKGAIQTFSVAIFRHPNRNLCSDLYEQRGKIRLDHNQSINAARDFFLAGGIEIAWAKAYLERDRSEDAILHLNKSVELGSNEADELLNCIDTPKRIESTSNLIQSFLKKLPRSNYPQLAAVN